MSWPKPLENNQYRKKSDDNSKKLMFVLLHFADYQGLFLSVKHRNKQTKPPTFILEKERMYFFFPPERTICKMS